MKRSFYFVLSGKALFVYVQACASDLWKYLQENSFIKCDHGINKLPIRFPLLHIYTSNKKDNIAYAEPSGGCIDIEYIGVQIALTQVVEI